ncbi:glycosyltransferase family 1 protein [Polaribacter sp. ALD11]|uniref:glycosyltransferase family 4 protein n=1 Tax=Polaribacter sp. ALD11 TaxID=2058137 RepID=UPI000C30544C|nr:glycosyltransferase family 4 protein [Polaribacter sp. ALD11]AUC84415.1 glycosyltransferase family 1 protein [Polaribacter sp. ALD11]
MHICFLTNEYPNKEEPHGGIGTFVKFLAEKLIENGVFVSVIGIYKNEESLKINGVNIYRLKKSDWKFAKFYHHNNKIQKKIIEIQKELPIDIIEGSELNFAFFSKETTYKKVIRLHGGHHFFASEEGRKTALWRSYQEKISFKKADYYISVSNYVGEETKRLLNYQFNFKTIYNSIDLNSFYKSDKKVEIQHKLLYVGTVCEKKGIEKLISAMPLIKKKYPNIVLEIAGRDWVTNKGESYIKYLKSIISEDTTGSIKFIGNIPYSKLPKKIESAHVCIFPSLAESFGLTLIEAMAMGKLIAASNIKPFKEIVGNSSSIVFFNPFYKTEIYEKVSYLLSIEKDLLRDNSRKHVFKIFNSEKILKDNIDFYNSLLKK